MKAVGASNVWALRQLLKKKFEKEMKRFNETFQHTFSKAEPNFTLTVEVNSYEFSEVVLEAELSIFRKRYEALQAKYDELKAKYESTPAVKIEDVEVEDRIYDD